MTLFILAARSLEIDTTARDFKLPDGVRLLCIT